MARPERDKVLGHADEADGIEEYDNPLPMWWSGLFLVTVVYGVVYAVDYHFVSHRSEAAELAADMKANAPAMPAGGAVKTAAITPENIAAGKAVFDTNCVGCHGPELHGGVGPDLTDATWIHGGTLQDITNTVYNGVPDKGMLTWGPILGPDKVATVAVFVHESGGGQ